MVKILDKDSKTILVKFTISEYQKITDSGILASNIENLDDYEFIFDKPIKASDLLKTF